jgi:hypothetical protein
MAVEIDGGRRVMNGDAWKEGSFIDVGPQGMINLDHVRRYEYARDGRIRVWWANGDMDEFNVVGRVNPEKPCMVPAQPGFELVYYCPDYREELDRYPVIAWSINDFSIKPHYCGEGIIAISPSLSSATESTNARIAVRHPDGVVSHYKDALTWKDVEEWKKWVREDLRQAEEEKKEAAE